MKLFKRIIGILLLSTIIPILLGALLVVFVPGISVLTALIWGYIGEFAIAIPLAILLIGITLIDD